MSRPLRLPYVVVAVVGQRLVIRNQDATPHNIAAIEAPATVITLDCDIYTWMRGYVVGDHARAAVTDARGQFRLRDVPAGEYDLEAWHPHLKRMTRANLTLQAATFRKL